MTGLDLLRAAFRDIGIIHPGQGLAPEDISEGLFVFNAMLDAWNIERLSAAYSITRYTAVLTPAKSVYTIGPGADFDRPRPPRIDTAGMLIGSDEAELLVQVVTAAAWRDIQGKAIPSGIVEAIWYEPSLPSGAIHMHPIPSAANRIALYLWSQLTQISTVNTTLVLPPGYADALRYNLAVRLASEWRRPLGKDTVAKAEAATLAIQALNAEMLGLPLAKPAEQPPK